MAFKEKVILSFRKSKMEFDNLKNNVHGWISSLHSRQNELEARLKALEEKLEKQRRLELY